MSQFGSNVFPRVPLHMQSQDVAKARTSNPSWESFRPNQIHAPEYRYQGDDRPNTHMMSVMRRAPDGQLDLEWAKNMVLEAIHGAETPHGLQPVHAALLTVVFPDASANMEPMQADMMTRLSASEKRAVRALVEAHIAEEMNWNAGRGGGSTSGRSRSTSGTP